MLISQFIVSVPDEAFRESLGQLTGAVETVIWQMQSEWNRDDIADIVVLPIRGTTTLRRVTRPTKSMTRYNDATGRA